MIIVLKAIFGWILFLLIGTNLIGVIVRGLLQPIQKPELNEPYLLKQFKSQKRANIFLTSVFVLISIGYLFCLYHFWNIGVSISAGMIMLSRIPDLINEIKTGQKIKFGTRPRKPLDYFMIIVQWGALPLIWYSLYVIE